MEVVAEVAGRRRDAQRDRGAIGLLVVVIATVVTAAGSVAIGHMWGQLDDAARARTAADAAALAGLDGGRAAATRLASANGGSLVGWWAHGDVVEATVRVGGSTAVARATMAP